MKRCCICGGQCADRISTRRGAVCHDCIRVLVENAFERIETSRVITRSNAVAARAAMLAVIASGSRADSVSYTAISQEAPLSNHGEGIAA